MPNLRIKPFPVSVDSNYPNETWMVLKKAVEGILQKQPAEANFQSLYQHAYGMYLHKHGSLLHQRLREVIVHHLETRVRVELAQSFDCNFLNGLKQVWEDFAAGMLLIKDIFMYMDRKVEGIVADQLSVYSMSLVLFRDAVLHYGQVRERLQATLLDLIAQERRGEIIDRATIKGICAMLMELGAGTRTVYEQDFEKAYLAESAEYFQKEAQRYLAMDNAGDYVRNVEQLIQTEGDRTQQYLDPSTKAEIDKLIDEQLIEKHMDTVVSMPIGGVVSLIQGRNFTEMTSMFKMLNRITDGAPKMLMPMSSYLRQQGTALMLESPNNTKSPVQLIQSLLDLKREYDLFLEKSFKKDPRFRRTIAADFEYFFNLNKRAPELLVLFIDEQLKNASKNLTEQQLNSSLDQAMTLFRYLHEKDIFERYYKHYLARRLLNSRSTSDDSEKIMLSKLRHECGYSYTSKLEGMYRDIIVSTTFNEKFHDHCFQNNAAPIPVELNVQVLTTGFWPMPTTNVNVNLPFEVQKAFTDFRKLYLEMHNGRQLNLQNNLGTVELAAEFYGPPAVNDRAPSLSSLNSIPVRKHILHVTTYQMCVLTLFNRQTEWSYQDIIVATNIPEKDLKRTLGTLSTGKLKILLKLGTGKFTESSTRFVVNENFYSQLYRVKMNAGPKMDFPDDSPDEERKDVRDKIESDRRHELDAAIIRIMKGRQQLDHNELIAELSSQLRHRFTPTMDMIKKSIEGLIAREYLSRTEENRSLYRYIA